MSEEKVERFFKDIVYLEDGKRKRNELLLQYHPDKHPEDKKEWAEKMTREVVAQFHTFLRRAKMTKPEASEEEQERDARVQRDMEFYRILQNVMDNINCNVEVIGNWIWCFDVNAMDIPGLAAMGFQWSDKHRGFFHTCGYSSSGTGNSIHNTDDLRRMWGSDPQKGRVDLGSRGGI